MTTTLIAPPEGYDAVKSQSKASRVLRYLLTTYPNTVIGHAAICEVLGFPVTAQAVSNAASRLRAGSFGMHIQSLVGPGGGYVLLVPVPATGPQRCGSCAGRSVIGTCRRLKGRPVEDSETCYGWSGK